MSKIRKSRGRKLDFHTKEGNVVQVQEKEFKKFLSYVTRGDFCKVTIEVEDEGVLCTYETREGTGKTVLKNQSNK